MQYPIYARLHCTESVEVLFARHMQSSVNGTMKPQNSNEGFRLCSHATSLLVACGRCNNHGHKKSQNLAPLAVCSGLPTRKVSFAICICNGVISQLCSVKEYSLVLFDRRFINNIRSLFKRSL